MVMEPIDILNIYIYTPTHIYVYMPTYVYTHGFEVDIDTQWHGKNTCMNYKDDLTNMFFKKKLTGLEHPSNNLKHLQK